MNWSHQEALRLLQRWEKQKSPLRVAFWQSTSALDVTCSILQLSEDEVTLSFGHVGFGAGNLTLPLRDMEFTYSEPADRPFNIRAQNQDLYVCWLELRFPVFYPDRCIIGELKPYVFA